MQFVIALLTKLYLDSNRRENSWKRRRRQQDLPEQGLCLRIGAHRDTAHVPQNRPLGIEIRRTDQQEPSLASLRCNLADHLVVDIFFDQPGERGIVDQRGAFQQVWNIECKDILPSVTGKNLAELAVTFTAKKRERGNK